MTNQEIEKELRDHAGCPNRIAFGILQAAADLVAAWEPLYDERERLKIAEFNIEGHAYKVSELERERNDAADQVKRLSQILKEIAEFTADAPKEICTTSEAARWLRDKYRNGEKALRELEKIRTEKLAARGLADEATAVSAARHILSNVPHDQSPVKSAQPER